MTPESIGALWTLNAVEFGDSGAISPNVEIAVAFEQPQGRLVVAEVSNFGDLDVHQFAG